LAFSCPSFCISSKFLTMTFSFSFLFLPPMTIIYAALHNNQVQHHIEPNHRFFLAKQH
jgi:hypothetical protein